MSRADAATRAAWIVAGLGLVLLGLLFVPWWQVDWPAPPPTRVSANGDESMLGFYWSGGLDPWSTTSTTSLIVAAFSIVCVLQALVVRHPRHAVVGWVLVGASLAVVLWIAARMIWPPDALLVPAWGAWTSLAVAVAILLANGMDSIAGR